MDRSAVARLGLRLGTVTALVAATAFGVGSLVAGAAGLAPAGVTGSVPVSPDLAGVSCPTVSECMVVGQAVNGPDFVPQTAIWNGAAWRWSARPPAPAQDAVLSAVTCLSAASCIAIGNTELPGSTGGLAFGDQWNGATWRAMPALAGPTFTHAHGRYLRHRPVLHRRRRLRSGRPQDQCDRRVVERHLVGGADAGPSGRSEHDHLQRRVVLKPDELPGRRELTGPTPMCLPWPRRSTAPPGRMQAVPDNIAEFAGVTCPKANLCLATGTGPGAKIWNGRTWRDLIPPHGAANFRPTLTGVSCASASSCILTGGNGLETAPIAYAWTGGASLKKLSIPDQAGQLSPLFSVSCARSTSCLAVGAPLGDFSSFGNSVAAWDGSKWQVIQENKSDLLAGVSCVTSADCLAVGSFENASDESATLAQSWQGKAWRLVSPPKRLGELASASCLSKSFCLAVGPKGALTWNGSTWKASAGAGNLGGGSVVSCGSTRFCAATGPVSGIDVWQGSKWHHLAVSIPSSAATSDLLAVSCASASFCVAVGTYSNSFEGVPAKTFVNVWNGHRWQFDAAPAPGTNSILTSISCVRPAACMAVGNYIDASKAGHNLALKLSGGKWRVVAMPGGTGPEDPEGINGPASVSCSSATSCVAVGDDEPDLGSEAALVWNGRSWKLTKAAPDANDLASVSCATPTFCLAVGAEANVQLTERWNGRTWTVLRETNP